MAFRHCPDCGASLDPSERCDCKEKEDAPAGTGTPSGGNSRNDISTVSVAEPFWDVKNLLRLKEVLEQTGAMAKDVAPVVQNLFPKFNRQLLAQAGAYEKYGVIIHPDGLKAICDAYGIRLNAIEIPITVEKEAKPKKAERRRLGRKLTFRMTDGDFEVLQQRVQDDGFSSVQAWLYQKITELLGGVQIEHS